MSKTADEGRTAGGLGPLELAVHPLMGREMQRDFGDWSKAVAACPSTAKGCLDTRQQPQFLGAGNWTS